MEEIKNPKEKPIIKAKKPEEKTKILAKSIVRILGADISGEAKCLLVPLQDTRDGLDIYLDIQNIEDGTVKTVSINGFKIKSFSGGERLNMRFTDLIYDLAETRYRRIWDWRYSARQFITEVRIIIQVDLVSGKSRLKNHWSKDAWLNDENFGQSTFKLEF